MASVAQTEATTTGHKAKRPWADTLDIWGAVAVLVALAFGLITFAVKHLPDPNIWFDESGQYWLSRGLNHDSAIDAPPQWIGAGVLDGMTGFNLDPPGFTVALGVFIQLFGSAPAAIRLLPFLAFVTTIAVFYLLGRKVLKLPRTISLALPPLALTTAIPLFYSTEIRAYSAELLAVSAALLTTALLIRSRSVKGAIPFMATLLLGMLATRYYFIVAAASMGVVYLAALIVDRQWRQRLRQILAVVGAYVVAGLGAAWSIGVFGPGTQIGYGQGYAQSGASLAKTEDPLSVVLSNLTQGEQRATGAFLVLGALLVVISAIRTAARKLASKPRAATRSRPLWVLVWCLVLAYEITAAALSYFADIPWDISGRWSIGLWPMAAASLLGLAGMAQQALEFLPQRPRHWIAVMSIAAVALPTVFTTTSRLVSYDRPDFRVLGSNLIDLVKKNVDPTLQTQWAVDYWTWPGFRWLSKESGLWPEEFDVTNALPVGDGVLTNANWPDVIPNLSLCPPGQQTVVIQERWNDNYGKREVLVTNWGQQQRCRVTQVDIGNDEMLLVLSPPQ